jgi:hypothetical protein
VPCQLSTQCARGFLISILMYVYFATVWSATIRSSELQLRNLMNHDVRTYIHSPYVDRYGWLLSWFRVLSASALGDINVAEG